MVYARGGRSVRRVRCSYGARTVSRTVLGTVFGPCVARRMDLGLIRCSYGATYRKDDGHGAIPAVDPAEVFGAGANLKRRLTSLFIPLSASGYRGGNFLVLLVNDSEYNQSARQYCMFGRNRITFLRYHYQILD